MRLLALAGVLGAGCGGSGVFACLQSDECGAQGVCEANGFCSFPDDACASGQRYGGHAPDGIAGACVEPSGESSTDASTTTTTTTSPPTTTAVSLDGGVSTSASSSSSASSSETTGALDTSESSTTAAPSIQLGPIAIVDDLDDGAMWKSATGPDGQWLPSGERPGLGFCGEYPVDRHYFAYLRFTLPEALPAGATIESATLELTGHAIYQWDSTHALRVWAEQNADAPQVSGLLAFPDDLIGVQLGDSSVRWADMDTTGLDWQIPGPNASPDLAQLVQELVDANAGLEAGAHVQLWVAEDELGDVGEEVGWLDSSAAPETAPRLTIVMHQG